MGKRTIDLTRSATLSDAAELMAFFRESPEQMMRRIERMAEHALAEGGYRRTWKVDTECAPESIQIAARILYACSQLRLFVRDGQARNATSCALYVGILAADLHAWDLVESKQRKRLSAKAISVATRLKASDKARARAIELAAAIPKDRLQVGKIVRKMELERFKNKYTKQPYSAKQIREWIKTPPEIKRN